LYHSTSNAVSLYEADCDHANCVADPTRRGLSRVMKDFVKEKYNEGIITKPNTLLDVMRLRKMKELKKHATRRILANDTN